MFYLYPFIVSFVLCLVITPVLKRVVLHFKIVDHPHAERKIHKKPIALSGGIAIFISIFLSVLIFFPFNFFNDGKTTPQFIFALLAGGVILMIGGILDDKYDLSPKYQILFPLLAAAIVIVSGMNITFVTNPLGGVITIPRRIGIPITFVWLLGMMYTTKLLDGLDGLVSGISVIGAMVIFIVSLFWDVPHSSTSVLALLVAGASLAFLFFNFYPAKIFLGEGGSLFLGFTLGILAIISGSKIATALLIMGVPIIDVFWVIIQRLRQKKLPSTPGQEHLHFRLLQKGFSHRKAVIFLYCITAIFGSSSLFFHTTGKIFALIILLITCAILFFTILDKKTIL